MMPVRVAPVVRFVVILRPAENLAFSRSGVTFLVGVIMAAACRIKICIFVNVRIVVVQILAVGTSRWREILWLTGRKLTPTVDMQKIITFGIAVWLGFRKFR